MVKIRIPIKSLVTTTRGHFGTGMYIDFLFPEFIIRKQLEQTLLEIFASISRKFASDRRLTINVGIINQTTDLSC